LPRKQSLTGATEAPTRRSWQDCLEASRSSSFAFELPTQLAWLPNEIVYSFASRFHQLSCNPVAHLTARQLFGNALRGYQHDLPSGIAELVWRTNGALGTVQDIVYGHTLLPFYLPFRSRRDGVNAYAAMGGDHLAGLKFRLGITTSRFRANHPLRACAACMYEDRRQHQVAYWHLRHQYPGVYICPIHFEVLQESTLKATGAARFQWSLPSEKQLTTVLAGPALSRHSTVVVGDLLRLAESAIALAELPFGFHFEPTRLLALYRRALVAQGYTKGEGSLRLATVARHFSASVSRLRSIRDLSAFARNEAESVGQLSRLLRQPRGGTHPLRHLAIIQWLFSDWATFKAAYEERGTAHRPSQRDAIDHGRQTDPRRAQLVTLIAEQGHSVTGAGRILGVDPTTAMVWAAKAGIATPRRPKVVATAIRLRIVRALRQGQDKSVIASAEGVSIQAVTTILRTEVGLYERWTAVRFQSTRIRERKTWRRALRNYGSSGVTFARQAVPGTYAWLYRNDYHWLLDHKIRAPLKKSGNNAVVDWRARDDRLAQQVRAKAAALGEVSPGLPIPLWRIMQLLPEVKAKSGVLDRLPKTKRALAHATARLGPDNRSRRLF